jgi:hypothetical protein
VPDLCPTKNLSAPRPDPSSTRNCPLSFFECTLFQIHGRASIAGSIRIADAVARVGERGNSCPSQHAMAESIQRIVLKFRCRDMQLSPRPHSYTKFTRLWTLLSKKQTVQLFFLTCFKAVHSSGNSNFLQCFGSVRIMDPLKSLSCAAPEIKKKKHYCRFQSPQSAYVASTSTNLNGCRLAGEHYTRKSRRG